MGGVVGRLEITVNGIVRDATGTPPQTNLLTWLRSIGLTAAKEGCAEGECCLLYTSRCV